jgi:hypothetical protein
MLLVRLGCSSAIFVCGCSCFSHTNNFSAVENDSKNEDYRWSRIGVFKNDSKNTLKYKFENWSHGK